MSVVQSPLRAHERRLAELVEMLIRAARARVGHQSFGARELATLLFSLSRLGYWQPPLLHLAASLADYGAERLRSGDAISASTVLQVLSMARVAAAAGQPSAARLLEDTVLVSGA
ncbi:hypothetical protein GPECTOR_33g666 [Gonium pectorale]|uniref:Uncharacterized protein n=1 Tax=Gonium pectorale TaxID=33097 RepID=A0A150GD70_GONPE|nr:hypothetical protein GPECTOR_33g666 [Gonium pectorale]|eukprot:KXZ47784.1 hypothetical protein GPECTOR_33g666 [Gonium pectorale]